MKSDLNEVVFPIAHASASLVPCEIEKIQFKGQFSDPPAAGAVGTRHEGVCGTAGPT
jgi:hypothetical protein